MPITLLSSFCPISGRSARQHATRPMPFSGALETKTILKTSRWSQKYHSIILPRPSRGPLPLSVSAPSIKTEISETETNFTCKDFKVGNCEGEKLVDGLTMPLVLHPNNNTDMQSLLVALEKNNDWFKQMIIKHSAVLLRGFNVRNAEDFNDIVETFGWDDVHYVGPAPRKKIFKRIWTANEGPLSQPIDYHHEMSLVKGYPENVMLFCEEPPSKGGETPFVPSCRVAERMNEEFPEAVQEMEEKGLKYTFKSPLQDTASYRGRRWTDIIGSSNRIEAAQKSKAESDVDVEWLPDGSALSTFAPRPLTKVFEGRKGRKVWFNLIHLFYKTEVSSATMMDGTEIPENIVTRMQEIIEEESIQFRWEKGDVLFLDNLALFHGRRASSAPRKVLVSMCKVASA